MRRLLASGIFILSLVGCQNQTQTPPQAQPVVSAPAAAPKEFQMEGEIISVDKEQKKATIKHGAIEGYMSAMTMAYPIPEQADLDKIKPGDHITATVYDSEADAKYWVGNIQVGAPASK